MKHPPTELMIGNQNRKKDDDEDDDESVKDDVISNRRITSGKCRMSCGHFTGKLKIGLYIYCIIQYAIDIYIIIPIEIMNYFTQLVLVFVRRLKILSF